VRRLTTDISFQHGVAAWLVALVILLAQHRGDAETSEVASRASAPSACAPGPHALATAGRSTALDRAREPEASRLLALIHVVAEVSTTLDAARSCARPTVRIDAGAPSLQPPARAPPLFLH
jgi:hypothetical protein